MFGYLFQGDSNKSPFEQKYVSVQNQMMLVCRDEDDYLVHFYEEMISLRGISLYLDETIDKYGCTMYLVKIVALNRKVSNVFGCYCSDTRNLWFYAILLEYCKALVNQDDNSLLEISHSKKKISKQLANVKQITRSLSLESLCRVTNIKCYMYRQRARSTSVVSK